MALSNSAIAAPCSGDDLACIKRLLVDKLDELASAQRELAMSQKLVQLSETQNGLLRQDNENLRSTVKPLLDAATAAKPPVWESPWLWFGVGIFLGGGLVVLGGWAVVKASGH
jgi:hypothetical protein